MNECWCCEGSEWENMLRWSFHVSFLTNSILILSPWYFFAPPSMLLLLHDLIYCANSTMKISFVVEKSDKISEWPVMNHETQISKMNLQISHETDFCSIMQIIGYFELWGRVRLKVLTVKYLTIFHLKLFARNYKTKNLNFFVNIAEKLCEVFEISAEWNDYKITEWNNILQGSYF